MTLKIKASLLDIANMDIQSYFGSSASSSASSTSCGAEEPEPDSDIDEPPSKKTCSLTSKRKYSKNWEKQFSWLVYDQDIDGAFCRVCKDNSLDSITQHTGGVWVSKPFCNWKKAIERIKAHVRSALHVNAIQALSLTSRQGSVVQQLQRVSSIQKDKNRAAMKSLLRCTHFLTRHNIAHSTNFTELVDLVVSCGTGELQVFVENAGRNAVYTSRGAVVDFIEAIGTWVGESILKRLQKAQFFSIMADECTDISTIEELSVFCRWEENGTPTECFLDLLPLTKADAESIYTAIVACLRNKSLHVGDIVGMGFDGAATFSGKKNGVQARLKKHAPHAIFVHCHCHML